MTETKKIFIKSLISGLKIDVDENPFEYQAVIDGVEFIKECDFMDFYNEARRLNTYGDGIKAIIETAAKFKPAEAIDDTTEKAKELIELVRAMNNAIYQDHIRTGKTFDDLLEAVKFPNINADTLSILNNVEPYYNHKRLVGNINTYQNSLEVLEAFKKALNKKSESLHIENNKVRQLIGGMR